MSEEGEVTKPHQKEDKEEVRQSISEILRKNKNELGDPGFRRSAVKNTWRDDKVKLQKYIAERFSSGVSIMDYSAGNGVALRGVAESLADEGVVIKKMVLTNPSAEVNSSDAKQNMMKMELLEDHPDVAYVTTQFNAPPQLEETQSVDLVTVNDVVTFVDPKKAVNLLQGLSKQTTENGLVVVTLSDGQGGKVKQTVEICTEAANQGVDNLLCVIQNKDEKETYVVDLGNSATQAHKAFMESNKPLIVFG